MPRIRNILLIIALICLAVAAIFALRKLRRVAVRQEPPPVTLEGSVLKADPDPRRQTPLSGVTVTAEGPLSVVSTKSNPDGFFRLTLDPGVAKGQSATLTFSAPNYMTFQITASRPGDQLYIARLEALQPAALPKTAGQAPGAKVTTIRNLQVRYSFKKESTMGVGSLAKQFSAPNKGDVPCSNKPPCSPDGRWKATLTKLPIDAGEGNEFRNVRVSCIAGPCAFTRVEFPTGPARKVDVSVLNWSDPADFLVEADVMRTMMTDEVRYSYPFIVGQTMSFALPPSSEGPSVEADFDNEYIVCPLGPDLIVSWGTCSVDAPTNGNKVYRCQLKPGYRFE